MVGVRRLRQLRNAVEQVLQEGVPGDLLEAGVWRGGACILMRGILAAYGVSDRKIWACDSFQGLPAPSGRFEEDAGDKSHTYPQLSVSLERVRANFSNYGLLDDQVIFVEGWFKDTLRNIAADTFAVIRLDGDMYESTHDALGALYGKLAPGGFLIVDDYWIPACRKATSDFRSEHNITEPIEEIGPIAAFWRKKR
jgi:O-methyltransferase